MKTTVVAAASVANVIANLVGGVGKGIPLMDTITDPSQRSLLMTNGSITRLIADMIIEPKFVIQSSLKNNEITNQLIERNLTLFCGLYTLAFQHMVKSMGVDVNTSMSLLSSTKGFDAKSIHDMTFLSRDGETLDLGALDKLEELTTESKGGKVDEGMPFVRNLNIQLEVFKAGEDSDSYEKIIIPVMIKASVKYVSSSDLSLLIDNGDNYRNSFWSRWDDMMSGEISGWNLFFPTDMMKAYKKRKLRDNNEVLKDLRDMEKEAHSKLITHGAVGYGKYYRFLFIDNVFKNTLQYQIGEKLSKGDTAQYALEMVKSLSLNVVDVDIDTVTTYVKDIKGSADVGFRDLTKGGDNGDTKDILAYLAGMK